MLTRRHILGWHLFAEVARTWLVVAGVLLFLTLGLGFAKFITQAAAGDLPVDTVLRLAFLSAMQNGGIVLPLSMLLAVLLTLGRLCRDNEMAAMQAGGAGLRVIYRPFITLALLVALLAGGLSLLAAPQAGKTIDQLTAQTIGTALRTLAPGKFLTLLDGDAVFYAESRDDGGVLHNVFIRVVRSDSDGETIRAVVTAKRALQRTDPDTGAQILVLEDGWRYEGRAGEANWRIVHFAEHGVRVDLDAGSGVDDDVGAASTATLLASDEPEAAAELQARLSVPLSILILTLLGLPLGKLPPRAGRYGRIIVGVLLYVVYFNLIHLATVWVETRALPALVGAWAVHGAMLLLAIGLIVREQGVFVRRRRQVAT